MLRTASSLPLCRAFDAGLRRRAFPPDAASLLPGLLAATRTGLPPAGDDELTNTKNHHGVTSQRYLPFYWAHEISRLIASGRTDGQARHTDASALLTSRDAALTLSCRFR
jgi:hypothetical protein